jgi:hypothetical protein
MFAAINKEREKPIVICSIRAYPRAPRLSAIDADTAWMINQQL